VHFGLSQLVNKVKQILERLERGMDSVLELCLGFAGSLIVLMAFLATYGVVRRYFLRSPEAYSYEISLIFWIISFILAAAAVERQNRHLRMDIVSIHLPQNVQNILLNIVGPIAGLIFCVILTWKGGVDAWRTFQLGTISMSRLAEPLYPVKFILTFGYGMLCLVLIARLSHGIASLKKGTKKLTKG
jgi:TRAP-type C4-dicarboxylate transport system permease small subunit